MIDLKKSSIEIIVKNQSNSGAYIACPNFNTYKYCWLRDGSFIANSMDVCGEYTSSDKFLQWVNKVIISEESIVKKLFKKMLIKEELKSSDFLPTRYTLLGEETLDEWPNFQIDGYGTWLWALCEHIRLSGHTELINKFNISISITIDYLLKLWKSPNYDCWEENGDKIHPSTLACIYGGLKEILRYVNDERIPEVLKEIKLYILSNCIYDGRLSKYQGSKSIDASLLWVAIPFGLIDVKDDIITKTVIEMEKKLNQNGGVRRYPEDTYYGGGEWILLSCWLGLYYVEIHQESKAREILDWVQKCSNSKGELPEQVLNHVNNVEYIKKWERAWGKVANPLLWSQAMYLILLSAVNNIH